MIRLRTMPGVLPQIKFFMTTAFARLALRFNCPPLRFFLLAAALALAGCQKLPPWWPQWWPGARQQALPEGIYRANGRLELTRVDVAAKYPGRLRKAAFQEGERVQAGQVLAVQEDGELQAKLAQARAALARARSEQARARAGQAAQSRKAALARLEWQQAQSLLRQQQISPVELEKRQLALDAETAVLEAAQGAVQTAGHAAEEAQAQIELAQAMLESLQLRAPLDGRVEYRLAEPGAMLAPGSRVATLLDAGDAWLTVFFPAAVAGRLKVGDEARVTLEGLSAALPATVALVDEQAQFTPKYVETASERENLVYRVKLRIPRETALAWPGVLKGGVTGDGYVRTGSQPWPAQLQVQAQTQTQTQAGPESAAQAPQEKAAGAAPADGGAP